MNAVLAAARAKREKIQAKLQALVTTAEQRDEEERSFTDEEAAQFTDLAAKRNKLDRQIDELEKEEQRAEKAAAAAAEGTRQKLQPGEAVVGSEPGVYRRDAAAKYGEPSYLVDLVTATCPASHRLGNGPRPEDAAARLAQNWKEWQRDAEQGENKTFARRVVDEETRWKAAPDAEQRVNPNTTDGTGGEFVPPLWLVAQYVPLARPGRVIANRIPSHPLPPGVDQINLPKITTGSSTAIQSSQGSAVSSTDIVTATVSATVNTIAGQEDISLQLLEQSPIAMDGVVFDDLSRDYDQRLDIQCISGTGSSGQHKGALAQTAATANTTSALNTDATKINAVTCASVVFYDGQATSFTQFRSILNAITNIETLRFASPTAIWAHPRRVNSWQIASDATIGRPLMVTYGPYNALGQPASGPAPEGAAGELAGLTIIKDANIPILCATGSLTSGTGDCIGVVKEDDMLLWEGTLRMRALPEILSGTLQIRFQVYAYSAFMPHRYPASTTLITGTTGLAAAAY